MAQLTRRLLQTGQRLIAIAGLATLTSSFAVLAVQGATMPAISAVKQTDTESTAVGDSFERRFCPEDLTASFDALVTQSRFRTANWGIAVYWLEQKSWLYTHNAEQLLVPASNIKLLTSAAAMQAIAAHTPAAIWDFRDDLNLVNRHSNNARADEMLRRIGGQSRVRTMLAPLGVDPASYVQADGSGLSRRNRAQPLAFVALLKGMYEADDSGLFYESLPVGGFTGTLSNRFQATAAQGKVHAKTGTLNGVRALSGYLETEDYGTVIFSIIVNQPGQSGRVMLDTIDNMVLLMTQLETCD
ncbi:MAG: D-alanyl-D-alanine carboxypeptidase [Cyanobacteria bacterium P01_C01_bin.120]